MYKVECMIRFSFPHFFKVDNEILNFLEKRFNINKVDSQDTFSMEKMCFETNANMALYYLFPDFIDLSLEDSQKIVEWYIEGKLNIQLFYKVKDSLYPHGIYSQDFFNTYSEIITDYTDDNRILLWRETFSKYDNMW